MSAARRERLLALLDAYVPEDAADSSNRSGVREFLARPDPFRRADPEGHVTASAVVARPDGLLFLLVFHRKLGRWLQPGGHVEPEDHSLFAAAQREAREETGIEQFASPIGDAILDLDVHPIPAFGSEPPHVHFDVRFLLTTEDGAPASDGIAWFPWSAIRPADSDGSLLRAAGKARRRLGVHKISP
jgi:8-oxo-dGTP pyrophosphatase MutT (NUDIX family)